MDNYLGSTKFVVGFHCFLRVAFNLKKFDSEICMPNILSNLCFPSECVGQYGIFMLPFVTNVSVSLNNKMIF